ncbi:TlpA family protein disulfide reductase [Sphingobacterium athyrii]|uniref:Thioredoxin domain-containing protein n=1 Tax=Sphingobacterium athyrii TaxID=2152717 RepID=A0A363NPP1_9SPHI|nr:redoxin domain-containing protein [Sphingobacterium athyrii]PUV22762.1 hypothetical protein DCO56_21455 [Sphingobacterium athyrii]
MTNRSNLVSALLDRVAHPVSMNGVGKNKLKKVQFTWDRKAPLDRIVYRLRQIISAFTTAPMPKSLKDVIIPLALKLHFLVFNFIICFSKTLKNKQALFILVCLFHMFSLSAQTPRRDSGVDGLSIQPLRVGDSIPASLWDVPLPIINSKDIENVKTLREFQNKNLIIIDFWTVWCAPCINKLKDLSSQNHLIDSDAVILPITMNDARSTLRILQQNDIVFPCVYKDTLFTKYFPHVSVPHQIWIKDGRVAYITDGNLTSIATINNLVRDKAVQLLSKPSEINRKDLETLSAQDAISIKTDNLIFGSYFSKALPYSVFAVINKKHSLILYNHSILGFIHYANRKEIPFVGIRNRVIWNIPDSSRYRMELPLELLNTKNYELERRLRLWKEINLYCYYLSSHQVLDEQEKMDLFRRDLSRLLLSEFNVNAYVADRKVEAWCLYVRDAILFKKYWTMDKAAGKTLAEERSYKLINRPFQSLVSHLAASNYRDSLPIADLTGYKGNVNIELHADPKNLLSVDGALREFGLGIKKDMTVLPMLVIERRAGND